MSTTYEPNSKLAKPATGDTAWDTTLNGNFDRLEAQAPLSGLNVTPSEIPSTSLNVRVAPGSYLTPTGTIGSYAGSPSTSITGSSTVYLWLDGSGALQSGASFPATTYAPLAIVVTGSATITSITDERRPAGFGLFTELTAAADDSAASAAGVPVGGLYQASGTVRVRLT